MLIMTLILSNYNIIWTAFHGIFLQWEKRCNTALFLGDRKYEGDKTTDLHSHPDLHGEVMATQYLSSCRISRNIYGFRDSRSTYCLNSLFKPICFCWDWISVVSTYTFLKKLPPDLKTCVWKFFFWIIKGEFLLAIFWETEKQLHNLHSLKDEKKIFWTSKTTLGKLEKNSNKTNKNNGPDCVLEIFWPQYSSFRPDCAGTRYNYWKLSKKKWINNPPHHRTLSDKSYTLTSTVNLAV